ncbi:MAG TPA: hypothetical protein VH988_06900 [Thermoanaerobaculia bacterium]|nr:hypothetical protein [Thermoanaerobaculia bacterium]
MIDWQDTIPNGRLDCGEVVRFRITVSEAHHTTGVPITGLVTVPTAGTANWTYKGGSVALDPPTAGTCSFTVASGLGLTDSQAIVNYLCSVGAPPLDSYSFSIDVSGPFYAQAGGSPTVYTTVQQTSPSPTTVIGRGFGITSTGCPAPPPVDMAVTKTDGGISIHPGGVVPYTLAYTNAGSGAASGVVLTETVPANTTFNAAASSVGWSCAGGGAPGSTCTYAVGFVGAGGNGAKVFAVTVDPNIPRNVSQISNTVTVSQNETDANPANNTASDTTPVLFTPPDLALTKTLKSGTGKPGTPLIYTLTTTNAGEQDAAGVTMTETVPVSTRFSAAASSTGWSCADGAPQGTTCTLAVGTLAHGQSAARDFAVTILPVVSSSLGSIPNTACTATTTPGDPTANNCSTVTTPVVASPRLSLRKTLSSGSGAPGGPLVYAITVTNSGDQDAAPVVINDTVPANTVFLPGSSTPGWSCPGGGQAGASCAKTLGTIAGGGGSVVTLFAVQIDNPLPAGVTAVSNTACVVGQQGVCDTITVPTTGTPSLVVTKSLKSGTAIPGSVVVYDLAVQNTGSQDAASVQLSESVPVNTSFATAASAAGWTCAGSGGPGSACSYALGTVPGGGATLHVAFAVRIVTPLPAGVTTIANTACASFPGGPPAGACGTITIPAQGTVTLSIAKVADQPTATAGRLLTYTLSARNNGDQDAAGVVLTEVVPAATTFAPAQSSPGWACVPAAGSAGAACTLTVGSLGAGSGTSRTFAVQGDLPWPAGLVELLNTACVKLAPAAPPSGCATVKTPLAGGPVLSLAKTYSGAPLAPGLLMVFHLTARNTGDQDAQGVTLSETVPNGSTFTSAASSPGWVCTGTAAGSTCSFPLGALAAGDPHAVDFAVTALKPLPAGVVQIANVACVRDDTGRTACGDATTPLSRTLAATLVDALVHDSNSDGLAENGDVIEYTLTVTNLGTGDVHGVVARPRWDSFLNLVPGTVSTQQGSVVAGNGVSDTTVEVDLGLLPAGASAVVRYRLLVAGVTPNVRQVESQTDILATDADATVSDDPDTPEPLDPTATPVGHGPSVVSVPTLGGLGAALFVVLLTLAASVVLRRRRSLATA